MQDSADLDEFFDEDYYGYDNNHEGVFEEEIDMHLKGFYGLALQVNSVEHFPLLCPYLKYNTNEKKDFFTFVFNNFHHLNTYELKAINENFLIQDYVHLMFDYVIENKLLIEDDTFKKYLYNKPTNTFVENFQQQLTAYYAIEHVDKIQDSDWVTLFEPIYNIEYKHLFKNIHFEPKEPIFSKTFFKYFSEDCQLFISYMQCMVKNNWSKNMSFISQNFSSGVKYYLYDCAESTNHDNTLLEQIYIYHNPSNASSSKLSYDQLKKVFSKIYKDLPSKDLTDESNFNFLKSLHTGLYYLLDYLAVEEPEKIRTHFEKNPYVISQIINDLQKKSERILNSEFVDTFLHNVFTPNIDLLYTQSDVVKSIILSNSETKIKHFLDKNIETFSEKDKQHLIFNTLKSNIPFLTGLDSNKLIVSLQKFPLGSLEIFKENIELFLEIIKDSIKSTDDFAEAKECFNKVIINKKLEEKFSLDKPNILKRAKI